MFSVSILFGLSYTKLLFVHILCGIDTLMMIKFHAPLLVIRADATNINHLSAEIRYPIPKFYFLHSQNFKHFDTNQIYPNFRKGKYDENTEMKLMCFCVPPK